MKPIFTVHAGEYLVASYVEKRFKKYKVWLPSIDKGVDLLLTSSKSGKQVGLQVKFSKDFLAAHMSPMFHKGLLSCGWWTLSRDKIKKSKADFWIFVLYSFDQPDDPQYLIITPQRLLTILKAIHGNARLINTYFWVTKKHNCWEARGLNKSDQRQIASHTYSNTKRDMTKFLNDWDSIKKVLK